MLSAWLLILLDLFAPKYASKDIISYVVNLMGENKFTGKFMSCFVFILNCYSNSSFSAIQPSNYL